MSYGLGYSNQDINWGWITPWGGVQTGGGEDNWWEATAGTYTYNRWHWKTLKHNDEIPTGLNPYKVSIYIDYDKTFLIANGSSTNLVVNDSTGVNLQLRFVPRISHSQDFWHRGRGGSMTMENSWPTSGYLNGLNDDDYTQTPGGILSETWRIDDIKIQSYKSSGVNANLSTFYTNIGPNDVKMNISFNTPSKGEADGWEDTWQIALTTVNKEGVESALGADSRKISNTDITKSPNIDFVLPVTSQLLNSKEIKGYMKSSRNPNYHLQFIIDCEKMEIYSSTSEQRRSPFISDNIAIFSLNSKDLLVPNEIDSYESQTGLDTEVGKNKENMKCLFKTAIVANNILYAGNVFQNGVHYPDRMIKSLTNKFSVLPSTNFIDVAINDGDEIISLQFYKDKLLQFKRNKLYIINVSEDYEYLENTIENVGIARECQIISTPYGIAWINQRGCYLYDGEKMQNLIEGKLAYKSWKDSESSWSINEEKGASITYLNKSDKLLIYCSSDKDAAQTFTYAGYTSIESYDYLSGLGYQYDFKNKSWNNITSFDETYENEDIYDFTLEGKNRTSPTNQMISNFALDENGDSIAILKSSNAVVKWDDNPKQTPGYLDMQGYTQSSPNKTHRDFRIITKDYDFGAPSVNKKIYKVYVTFKSTDLESSKERKLLQQQDIYKNSNVGVYYAINGTNNWTEFSTTKSSNYGTKGLISDDAENTTTTTSYIGANTTSVLVASAANIKVGYVIKTGTDDSDEQMLVTAISGTTLTLERGYNETEQVSHSSSSTVYISTGDWIVAELKPDSSINNIDSLKLKFETKKRNISNDLNGVPKGFMINDISVIYRGKNVK